MTQTFDDLLTGLTRRPSDVVAYNFVVRSLLACPIALSSGSEGFDKDLKPKDCDSVEQLVGALAKKLNLADSAIDCFYGMLAVVIGVRVNGPMLWMHCVGPSSSMKTTLSMFVAAAQDRTYAISKITGLYSGMGGTEDNSLIPKINQKTLIIHDFTPLIQAPTDVQNSVFGDFRDIYSGTGRAVFKNGVVRDYSNITFGVITCVTDAIHYLSRSDLGERFLMMDIDSQWTPGGDMVRNTLDTSAEGNAFDAAVDVITAGFADQNSANSLEGLEVERAMCWGLMTRLDDWMSDNNDHLATLFNEIKTNTIFRQLINSLAIWLEHARCPVPPKRADPSTISRPALPHRSIKQLVKLTVCLSVVSQQTELTPETIRRVRKFAFDTAYSRCLQVMNFLARNGTTPKIQLGFAIGCSAPHAATICNHLVSIGVLEESLRGNGSGNRGRDATCYTLTAEFTAHARNIGIKAVSHDITPDQKTLAQILAGRPLAK